MSLFARVKSFIPRSSHEPGGFGYILRSGPDGPGPLVMPKDAAGYNVLLDGSFEWVTWSQIMDRRRERQREDLERIHSFREDRDAVRRAQVWVFDNGDIFPYGGWWCYVRTLDRYSTHGLRASYCCGGGAKGSVRENGPVAMHLMRLLPMGLFPHPQNFEAWCAEIAKAFPKRPREGSNRPEGCVNGWTDGRTFELRKEALTSV